MPQHPNPQRPHDHATSRKVNMPRDTREREKLTLDELLHRLELISDQFNEQKGGPLTSQHSDNMEQANTDTSELSRSLQEAMAAEGLDDPLPTNEYMRSAPNDGWTGMYAPGSGNVYSVVEGYEYNPGLRQQRQGHGPYYPVHEQGVGTLLHEMGHVAQNEFARMDRGDSKWYEALLHGPQQHADDMEKILDANVTMNNHPSMQDSARASVLDYPRSQRREEVAVRLFQAMVQGDIDPADVPSYYRDVRFGEIAEHLRGYINSAHERE